MKKFVKYCSAFSMIFAMILLSVLLKEKEIVFPEIFALVIGMWLCDKMPWKVGKIKMIVLITVMALTGVLLVRFMPISLEYKIPLAVFLSAIMLIATKCTFLPIISACVLPVIMGTESFIYPVSVFAMTAVIVIIRFAFEKCEMIEPPIATQFNVNYQVEVIRWLLILAAVVPISIIACRFNVVFLVAPPLLVAFAEFSYSDSPARKSPVKIFAITGACAFSGAYLRYVLSEKLGLSVLITASVITIFVLLIMYISKTLFPPAGALSILPLIISADKLLIYPVLVTFGAAFFILLSMIYGKFIKQFEKNKRENLH